MSDRPPAPVTDTEHGDNAEPVYVTGSVHETTVVEAARAMVTAAVATVLNA